MLRVAQSILAKPVNFYSNALDRNPLTTKCLTSGTMYAGIFMFSSYLQSLLKICSIPMANRAFVNGVNLIAALWSQLSSAN
jgi:hypothetical protein